MRLITAATKVLAYVFGRRKDEVFLKLKALLEHRLGSHDITQITGVPTRVIWTLDEHRARESGTRSRIERKHLTFRTRIKRLMRKTICFSKSTQMHDIVIGLFVNRYEFGLWI